MHFVGSIEGLDFDFTERLFIDFQIGLREAAEQYAAQQVLAFDCGSDGVDCNASSLLNWVAEDTSAYAWERNGRYRLRNSEFNRLCVAGGQEFCLAIRAATPDWPDRVNDELCLKAIGLGGLCLAGLATAKQPALVYQLGTGCSMDRTVYPTTTKQRGVGCIDDDIDIKLRDVALYGLKCRWHGSRELTTNVKGGALLRHPATEGEFLFSVLERITSNLR